MHLIAARETFNNGHIKVGGESFRLSKVSRRPERGAIRHAICRLAHPFRCTQVESEPLSAAPALHMKIRSVIIIIKSIENFTQMLAVEYVLYTTECFAVLHRVTRDAELRRTSRRITLSNIWSFLPSMFKTVRESFISCRLILLDWVDASRATL